MKAEELNKKRRTSITKTLQLFFDSVFFGYANDSFPGQGIVCAIPLS